MSSGLTLLPVDPRMTDKADSCGELSTAVITGKRSFFMTHSVWNHHVNHGPRGGGRRAGLGRCQGAPHSGKIRTC